MVYVLLSKSGRPDETRAKSQEVCKKENVSKYRGTWFGWFTTHLG